MKRHPQLVVRAYNVDGRTDLYYGGTDQFGASMWVEILHATKFMYLHQARTVAQRYGLCEVERITVFGSAPLASRVRFGAVR